MNNLIGKKILVEKGTELSRTLHKFMKLREEYSFTKKGKETKEIEISELWAKINDLVGRDIVIPLNIKDWAVDFTRPCSMADMHRGNANFYIKVVSMEETTNE